MKPGKLDKITQEMMDHLTEYYGTERITEMTEKDIQRGQEIVEKVQEYLEEKKKK
mgnify:CR=1 FL=1